MPRRPKTLDALSWQLKRQLVIETLSHDPKAPKKEPHRREYGWAVAKSLPAWRAIDLAYGRSMAARPPGALGVLLSKPFDVAMVVRNLLDRGPEGLTRLMAEHYQLGLFDPCPSRDNLDMMCRGTHRAPEKEGP